MDANPQPIAPKPPLSRRQFMRDGARATLLVGVGGLVGLLAGRHTAGGYVWQIDPAKCVRCGLCATSCVLEQSAVKCVHSHALCGYCRLCTGYFVPEPNALSTAAENQLCPTGAIQRTFVEDPYYEYTIDEKLCIGCAKCVEGCSRFGNGSLYLQVRHDRCLNCNECSIARVCAGDAFRRVPLEHPYLLKSTTSH